MQKNLHGLAGRRQPWEFLAIPTTGGFPSGCGGRSDPAAERSRLKPFVLTGRDLGDERYALETSRPGVFAIGDVRAGSTKRVAAAVGEGVQVVAAIHEYLAAHPDARARLI